MNVSRAPYMILVVPLFGTIIGCSSPNASPRREENETGKLEHPAAEGFGELKPWHSFRKEWATEATGIVKATYQQSKGPCIFYADGSSAMPVRSTFKMKEVLKGDISCPSFDAHVAGIHEGPFPHDFVEGRTYLVFINPHELSWARLKNSKTEFTFDTALGRDEFVAIIDLSQSESEAQDMGVQATRSGTFASFTFTPKKWAALRDAESIDLGAQKQFQSFIENVACPRAASLKDVRSYLGAPDDWYLRKDGPYYRYEMNHGAKLRKGVVSATMELSFAGDLKLARLQIKYQRYLGGDARSWEIEDLKLQALEGLGLKNVDR